MCCKCVANLLLMRLLWRTGSCCPIKAPDITATSINGMFQISNSCNAFVCVPYRMCSLWNVFSRECVLYRTCSLERICLALGLPTPHSPHPPSPLEAITTPTPVHAAAWQRLLLPLSFLVLISRLPHLPSFQSASSSCQRWCSVSARSCCSLCLIFPFISAWCWLQNNYLKKRICPC